MERIFLPGMSLQRQPAVPLLCLTRAPPEAPCKEDSTNGCYEPRRSDLGRRSVEGRRDGQARERRLRNTANQLVRALGPGCRRDKDEPRGADRRGSRGLLLNGLLQRDLQDRP